MALSRRSRSALGSISFRAIDETVKESAELHKSCMILGYNPQNLSENLYACETAHAGAELVPTHFSICASKII